MQPLIDTDVLRYEIGATGQYKNERGELVYRDFDWVASALDNRIADICEAVEATEAPILYITGDKRLLGEEFLPNFREEIAVSKGYKAQRKNEKPFHWRNITAYVLAKYDVRIANGCEADDLMGIEQYSRLDRKDTIICTRDKDLRMIPGLHYGWECGKQPEFGPLEYDDLGRIELVRGKSAAKIVGGGKAFFFAQLLTGDTVDNIGGLLKAGPVKAEKLLAGAKTEQEFRERVVGAYREASPDNYMELLREQSQLLWIGRELNDDNTIKEYEWPEE